MFRTRNPRGARALFACAATFATAVPALSGCGDESRKTGTQVEYDAAKHQVGKDKMREFMTKKAQGQIPGHGPRPKRS